MRWPLENHVAVVVGHYGHYRVVACPCGEVTFGEHFPGIGAVGIGHEHTFEGFGEQQALAIGAE